MISLVHLKIINHMVMEPFLFLMEVNILENGKMAKQMGKVLKLGKMEKNIMEILKMMRTYEAEN